LKVASSRATYISKTTQNDLIQCCGEEILSKIVARVQEAGFFSVLFDETTDIAHESQLTQALRYVYRGKIYEDFLGFINLREHVHNRLKGKDGTKEKVGRKERETRRLPATTEETESPKEKCTSTEEGPLEEFENSGEENQEQSNAEAGGRTNPKEPVTEKKQKILDEPVTEKDPEQEETRKR